jgi:hypothetical protein
MPRTAALGAGGHLNGLAQRLVSRGSADFDDGQCSRIVVRKSSDKASAGPKLYVLAINELHSLLDGLLIVGAFKKF